MRGIVHAEKTLYESTHDDFIIDDQTKSMEMSTKFLQPDHSSALLGLNHLIVNHSLNFVDPNTEGPRRIPKTSNGPGGLRRSGTNVKAELLGQSWIPIL